VFVLEANANPCLAQAEDFSQSALSAGIGYQDLLARIIALGLSYKAEWRADYA
jgi:D-alanine-D-alanine ligase-like ATP-grasp enzyme